MLTKKEWRRKEIKRKKEIVKKMNGCYIRKYDEDGKQNEGRKEEKNEWFYLRRNGEDRKLKEMK